MLIAGAYGSRIIEIARAGTERCDSGGAKQLLYQPKLTKADGFKLAPLHDGCFRLLERVH